MRLLLALCCSLLASPLWASDALAAARTALLERWPDAVIAAPAEALPTCAETVSAEAPGALREGRAQLRLRCEGNPGWTRFVSLQVQRPGQVLVLRRALARGEALSAELLNVEARDLARLPGGLLSQPEQAQGQLARRALAAGSLLSQDQLMAPLAIRRGDSVTLVGYAAGLEVRAVGEALADAAEGARLKVRNRDSRRVVEGLARSGGKVEIAP
jgi:flagella basal body P-ring formation protein FlgA